MGGGGEMGTGLVRTALTHRTENLDLTGPHGNKGDTRKWSQVDGERMNVSAVLSLFRRAAGQSR